MDIWRIIVIPDCFSSTGSVVPSADSLSRFGFSLPSATNNLNSKWLFGEQRHLLQGQFYRFLLRSVMPFLSCDQLHLSRNSVAHLIGEEKRSKSILAKYFNDDQLIIAIFRSTLLRRLTGLDFELELMITVPCGWETCRLRYTS